MPQPSATLAKLPTILLVDDDADILASLSDRLISEGFHIVTAHDGREALRCIEMAMPSLILLDLQMPVMDGAETLRAIRATHPSLPVILMTGADLADSSARAVALEASDYLPKPIDWQLLKRKLASALGE